MTWVDFKSLSLQKQLRTLYTEGTFIVAIRYYGHKINLYLLKDYYIEVFYNHKLDCIDRIDTLERNHTRMKFYSDQIKLPLEWK